MTKIKLTVPSIEDTPDLRSFCKFFLKESVSLEDGSFLNDAVECLIDAILTHLDEDEELDSILEEGGEEYYLLESKIDRSFMLYDLDIAEIDEGFEIELKYIGNGRR